MHFRESSFAQEIEKEISLIEQRVVLKSRSILVGYPLDFANVEVALTVESFEFTLNFLVLFNKGLFAEVENLNLLVELIDRDSIMGTEREIETCPLIKRDATLSYCPHIDQLVRCLSRSLANHNTQK